MATIVDLKKLKAEGIASLIATTEAAHPYLKANKRTVSAILDCISQTSCFLPGKPTPIKSSLAYLRTVLSSPNLDRADFVFVLVAINAAIGIHSSSTRSAFKVFPKTVDGAGWKAFKIRSKEDADKLEFALSDVFSLTKAEVANVQSCTNKLLKHYELYVKAMELYRQHQGGKSFSQAKQGMPGITDREYTQCLRILADAGLNEPRKTQRLSSNVLSTANAAFIQTEADRLEKTTSQILNHIIDKYRSKTSG